MVLKNLGVEGVRIVADEESTVICNLSFGVGCRLIPASPAAVSVNLSQSDRLPKSIVMDFFARYFIHSPATTPWATRTWVFFPRPGDSTSGMMAY
ncbi:MAG: hypothetical protein ACYC5X_18100 [Syntrophales bacterium]